jgi:hypothetical protein
MLDQESRARQSFALATGLTSASNFGMMNMKRHYSATVAAVFLLAASSLAARAEDAAQAPAASPAAPEPTPSSVARPSIVPKANDTAAKPDSSVKPQADVEPAPRRNRRYGYRHYGRYAYWEPFPIFFPHFTRHHGIYWSRMRWFF